MNFDSFRSSLANDTPPANMSNLLQAMWYDGKNNWDKAHDIAQEIHDNNGSWIHAYLHRKEGDRANAGYWYSKAGKPMPGNSLEKEWEEIVRALL